MSEPATPDPLDLRDLWRSQPGENLPLPSPRDLASRSARLFATTRSEILTAIAAMLFFAVVLALRFGTDRRTLAAIALAALWVIMTLCFFRRRVWSPPVDVLAASGAEFYRLELEERRKHLLNPWLWYGPLVLSCITLAAVAHSAGALARLRLPQVAPMLFVLVLWTALSIRRRRREAAALARELDQLPALDNDARP